MLPLVVVPTPSTPDYPPQHHVPTDVRFVDVWLRLHQAEAIGAMRAATRQVDRRPDEGVGVYTYALTHDTPLPDIGQGVWAPFRTHPRCPGIVVRVWPAGDAPTFPARTLTGLFEEPPLLADHHPALIQWLGDYYGCQPGEAWEMALPSCLLKPTPLRYACPQPEAALLTLQGERPSLKKQLLLHFATLPPKKREQGLALSTLMKDLGLAPKSKGTLQKAIKTLQDEGYLCRIDATPKPRKPTRRSSRSASTTAPVVTLTDSQQEVVNRLLQPDAALQPHLIHGVTGSGKTEVYATVAEQLLQDDPQAQVLILVPEITLTTQLLSRFQKRLGEATVTPWHSKLGDGERRATWHGVQSGEVRCILGARSAVFLPFQHLKLIVIDECHEPSYRQETSAPRYDARTVAQWLAATHHGTLVLGSATPTVSQLHQALDQKTYHYHRLTARPTANNTLPTTQVIDLVANPNEKWLDPPPPPPPPEDTPPPVGTPTLPPRRHYYSEHLTRTLVRELQATLDAHHQALVLLNRRGYHRVLFCEACRQVLRCPHCELTLTAHRIPTAPDAPTPAMALHCHVCDHREPTPTHCPHCDQPELKPFGGGSQKLEEELAVWVPQARTVRLDRDTTQRKNSVSDTLQQLATGEANLLIGTQMIAKGLDLPNVTLVGVVEADATLWMPDMGVAERLFQLLTQVAGRAGRGEHPGRVLVQTRQPDHPVLKFALAQDTLGFHTWELDNRHRGHLPPFTQLARWVLSSPDPRLLEQGTERLADLLEPLLPDTITLLGPTACPVPKVQGRWRAHLVFKWQTPPNLPQVCHPTPCAEHAWVIAHYRQLQRHPEVAAWCQQAEARFALDIEPISLM